MRFVSINFCLLLACLPLSLAAFEITGSKWVGARTVFYFDIPGTSASGIPWNQAVMEAIEEWNSFTPFTFSVVEESRDPCNIDFRNGIDFTDELCGSEFGENTLAVTLRRTEPALLGPPNYVETDIVINSDVAYDIFDGPLVQFGQRFNGLDFRRVMLHELGHALGLDHENREPAIMEATIGNIDSLQPDDIAGAEALYSGISHCVVQQLVFGFSADALDDSDCTVSELTAGGTDDSPIDLYSFTLTEPTDLQFNMRASELDAVLLMADAELNFFAVDASFDESCDSSLELTLGAGLYYLLANTFDQPVRDECQIRGSYGLESSYRSGSPASLGLTTSLLGGFSLAGFSGGITADDGRSFANRFTADSSLDISAGLRLPARHVGQSGFIVVAAIVEGQQLLFLDESGQFIPDNGSATPSVFTRRGILLRDEQVTIATDLVPSELDFNEGKVDFYVGYGLDAQPGEIHYHSRPINLIVTPEPAG